MTRENRSLALVTVCTTLLSGCAIFFPGEELILSGAGCTMMDLVKVDIHVVNSADLAKMNDVIAARLGGNRQVRTSLSAAKLAGTALLEVDIVARMPQ